MCVCDVLGREIIGAGRIEVSKQRGASEFVRRCARRVSIWLMSLDVFVAYLQAGYFPYLGALCNP